GAEDFIVTLDCHKNKIDTIKTKLEHDKVNIIITAKKGKFASKDVSFHHGPSKYDLIITVDTAALEQLGRFYEDNTEMFTEIPVINIDHHASNDNFGKINFIDVMSSATTELLIPLVEDIEKEEGKELMDEDVATLLLAGIITDTGSFQNANTTPRSFAASAKLIKHGARQQEIIQHVFKTKHLSTLRLWGRILSNINVDKVHRFVWSTISKRDFEDTGSRPDETGGIIDELLTNAPDAEIVLLLKQKEGGVVSGSLRSTTASVDASQIAEFFGGGGHVRAAGFKVSGEDLRKVEEKVIDRIRAYQAERLNLEEETEETEDEAKEEEIEIISEDAAAEGSSVPVEVEVTSTKKKTAESKPKKKTAPEKVEVEKHTSPAPEEDEETFSDIIVKQKSEEGDEETELEEGFTYKFED
ncbi:bifunctional oligoribonuclease/PAP phosphatase NrnA, partial [Pseudomonadota bacterium]